MDGVDEAKKNEHEGGKRRKLRVLKIERLANLRNRVMNARGDHMIIDKVYEELVAVMKAGLMVEVKEGRRGQPWFTKDMADLRKARQGAERE